MRRSFSVAYAQDVATERRRRRRLRQAPAAKPAAAPPAPTPAPAPPAAPESPPPNLRPEMGTGTKLAIAGLGALAVYLIFRRQIEDAIVQTKTTAAEGSGEGPSRYMPLVVDAANAANIPPSNLAGIVSAESSWSNKATSSSAGCGVSCIASGVCAIGLAQVLPSTARDVGVTGDLCIPANSLLAGARYLRRLFNKYSDPAKRNSGDDVWTAVRQAYNAGPGNYDNGKVYSGTVAYAEKAGRWTDKFQTRGVAGLLGEAPVFLTRSVSSASMRPNLFRAVHA